MIIQNVDPYWSSTEGLRQNFSFHIWPTKSIYYVHLFIWDTYIYTFFGVVRGVMACSISIFILYLTLIEILRCVKITYNQFYAKILYFLGRHQNKWTDIFHSCIRSVVDGYIIRLSNKNSPDLVICRCICTKRSFPLHPVLTQNLLLIKILGFAKSQDNRSLIKFLES